MFAGIIANTMSYNYSEFDFSGGYKCRIERVKKIYDTTPGGNFRKKPYETKTEFVDCDFYLNFVRSCDFFNGLFGGTCRASWNYTAAGYIPTRITTINPGRTEKHVDTFTFIYD